MAHYFQYITIVEVFWCNKRNWVMFVFMFSDVKIKWLYLMYFLRSQCRQGNILFNSSTSRERKKAGFKKDYWVQVRAEIAVCVDIMTWYFLLSVGQTTITILQHLSIRQYIIKWSYFMSTLFLARLTLESMSGKVILVLNRPAVLLNNPLFTAG